MGLTTNVALLIIERTEVPFDGTYSILLGVVFFSQSIVLLVKDRKLSVDFGDATNVKVCLP